MVRPNNFWAGSATCSSMDDILTLTSTQLEKSGVILFSIPKLYQHFDLEYPKHLPDDLASSDGAYSGLFASTIYNSKKSKLIIRDYFCYKIPIGLSTVMKKVLALSVVRTDK